MSAKNELFRNIIEIAEDEKFNVKELGVCWRKNNMRVTDLINLESKYLKVGIIIGIFIMLCVFAGYFLVYRKLLKGQKVIAWRKFLWWGIFLCYLSVVLGVTLLSRGGGFTNDKIQPLFYSYRDAWINF